MVLDASLDLVAWTSRDGGLPTNLRLDSDLASAATMRAFLDLCGEASTARCAFSAGSPSATQGKFAALLRRLRRHSVTIGTPPQAVSYAAAAALPLGRVSEWQGGASLLQQLWTTTSSGRRLSGSPGPGPRA